MEDREGNGVGFEIEFGLTGRRRRPFFGEVRGKATKTEEIAEIRCLSPSADHAGKFLITSIPYLFPTYLLGTDAYLHFLAAG